MDNRDRLESIMDTCVDIEYRLNELMEQVGGIRASIESVVDTYFSISGLDIEEVPKQERIEEAKRRREIGESPWEDK